MKSYNKFYYEKNKEQILVIQKNQREDSYHDFHGHIKPIHDAIRRYAKQWRLEIDSLKKFRRWTVMDAAYEQLFKAWEESDFDKGLTPVVMRNVKKQGFVITNLYWSVKSNHDWWSGLLEQIKNKTLEMEERQKIGNKSTKAEQEEMVNRLKAKRKK